MNWKKSDKMQLVNAVLTLEEPEEVQCFLRDLLTEKEIDEFAKRFQAAVMLDSNIPYTTIVQVTGLSSTTVARVSKFLRGKEGGYALVINKLSHHTSPQLGRGLS